MNGASKEINIKILFFGATAEDAGMRSLEMAAREPAIVSEIVQRTLDAFPGLARHRLLYSLNQEYVSADRRVEEGDELAIFTAVSGG